MDGIITFRDSIVNTYRVRRISQRVNNGPMAYSFAETLRTLRNRKGLKQEELAHACGWSGQSRIANYESTSPKARQPKPNDIPIIAKALGVTVAELFGESGSDQSRQSQPQRPDAAILANAVTLLKFLGQLQADDENLFFDAPSLLVAYDEVAREPSQVDLDREAVLRRMAATLRGKGNDVDLGRSEVVGAG